MLNFYSEKFDLFYKGHTNDLQDRLSRHNNKQEEFTSKGVPWGLLWSVEKTTKAEAYQLELKLKNLSRSRLINVLMYCLLHKKIPKKISDHTILEGIKKRTKKRTKKRRENYLVQLFSKPDPHQF